jgi:dipeptidyl aminopeptidase/acylaminoacyl peptidase
VARLAILAALAAGAQFPMLVRGAPLELYGRLPNLEDVALSPDGSRIVFVRTTADRRTITGVSLADKKPLFQLNVGETKLRGIEWGDNDHLLIFTSATRLPPELLGVLTEFVGLQVYDLRTRSTTILPVELPHVHMMNVVSGRLMIAHTGGHTVLFIPGIYITDRTLPGLFRFDLQTYDEKLVREGTDATRQWLVNEAGEIVAEQDYFEHAQRWTLNALRDGHMGEVAAGTAPVEYPQMLGFGPSGDQILMSALEEGEPVWRLLSLKDGTFGPPLAERRTLTTPIEDPHSHRMIGGVIGGESPRYMFFDTDRQSQWESVARAFQGERVHLVSFSDDFRKVVLEVEGRAHGFLYVLVDLNTHQAGAIGEVYEGLGKPLEVRPVEYAAADGLRISGYLTLPDGRPATKLPLIVMPHGGPAAHDTGDFDWWAQALAAQGYAVLQPNFRGSNVTARLLAAGFGEWGRKMQTDLSDGVRYLATQGIVDPARVCLVGASYGGYAALAGATMQPDTYRCAVSVAGISDLSQWLKWVNDKQGLGRRSAERYLDRFMGVANPGDPGLTTLSPISHLDALKAPVLLIHGRDDTVVPFDQSEAMYAAMKRANKPVELVTLQREDHWLSRSDTRLQMLQATVGFLRAHNPPD